MGIVIPGNKRREKESVRYQGSEKEWHDREQRGGWGPAHRNISISLENTAGSVDRAVNVAFITQISKIERANDIGADSIGFMILAPVDVWSACDTCGHEDV